MGNLCWMYTYIVSTHWHLENTFSSPTFLRAVRRNWRIYLRLALRELPGSSTRSSKHVWSGESSVRASLYTRAAASLRRWRHLLYPARLIDLWPPARLTLRPTRAVDAWHSGRRGVWRTVPQIRNIYSPHNYLLAVGVYDSDFSFYCDCDMFYDEMHASGLFLRKQTL